MLDTNRATARTRNRRLAATAAAVAVMGLHIAFAMHFLDFKLVFERAPVGGDDFNTHFGQTTRLIEGLTGWGKTWVYDVKLLAGQPEGTIFDADNKGWSLWTYALERFGVPRAVAFNAFVALAMSSAPLVLFGAARLFGYGAGASVCAAFLGSALWFFDSFTHWAWWVGMVSYSFAAYLALLPLGLFYRFAQSRKLRYAIACAPALGLLHLIHPYTFFILAPPIAVMYLRAFGSFSRREHAAVVAIAAVTLAINARWLLVAIEQWHYILDSAYFGQARLSHLPNDFFGLLRDPTDTGVIGTRTGFRFLCLGLCVCGLWRLHSERDPRFAPLATAVGSLFVLSYLGSYIPGAGQIQPYRHVIPLGFMAALPASGFLAHWASSEFAREASGKTLALLFVIALTATQHLASDALYFIPGLLPKVPKMIDGMDTPLSVYGYPYLVVPTVPLFQYRIPSLALVEDGPRAIENWLVPRGQPGERILIDSAPLGERMAWHTSFEIMGGFRQRNLAHSYANLFRTGAAREWTPRALEDYLHTFAISWVVTYLPRKDFAAANKVLIQVAEIYGVRIYRTAFPANKVLNGPGAVRARTNRIEVRDSDPTTPLLLSYHYHESLRCQPNCLVERYSVPLDVVGLIKVPAPHPSDLVIWNSYR